MNHIVIVSNDVVGRSMAGPAIRYWELAKQLSSEFRVTMFVPNKPEIEAPGFTLVQHNPERIRETIRDADAVLSQGFSYDAATVILSKTPQIFDLFDPLPLEMLEQFGPNPSRAELFHRERVEKRLQILMKRGSFFLCSCERQRDLWLGYLAACGRVNAANYERDSTLRGLIGNLPFGIRSEEPPCENVLRGVRPGFNEGDIVIVWGGGLWNWFDPLTPIQAMAEVAKKRDDVKLLFLGVTHPNPGIPRPGAADRAHKLAGDLGLLDRFVFFNEGWIPYEQRGSYLSECAAGISTHVEHLETRFSFRTRLLDYFWASLPVICTGGDPLSERVRTEGLGQVVAPGSVEEVAAAILRVAEDREWAQSCRESVREIRSDYHWDQVAKPLMEFCRNPHRAADLKGSGNGGMSLLLQWWWFLFSSGIRYGRMGALARRFFGGAPKPPEAGKSGG